MVHLVQTMHLSYTNTNTVSKWTKTRFDMTQSPRSTIWCVQNDFQAHGVQRKLCTYLVSRLALSPNRLKRDPLKPCHLGVPSGASKMIPKPMVLWRKSWTYLALTLTLTPSPNRPKQILTWATLSRSSIGCVQIDFQAYGMFAQTMHLSCVKISTISKQIEMSFHSSLVN
jgi:hypothetical protein